MGIPGSSLPVSGGRVWYRVVGDGPGTPLLAIHGIPGSSSGYLEGLSALGDDRPVVFYDQLGGGRSDRPADPDLWSIERFTDELATIRRALNLPRVHLLGHSWGGIIALEHALQVDGIQSLILSSVPVSIPDYVEDMQRLRAGLSAETLGALEKHERAGTTTSPEYEAGVLSFRQRHVFHRAEWPPSFVELLATVNPDVFVAIWGPEPFACTGAIHDYDGSAGLAALEMPVLFAVGRHDATTPEAAKRYCAKTARGSLTVFEHSAHMAMLEEPERFLSVIRKFLREVDGRGV